MARHSINDVARDANRRRCDVVRVAEALGYLILDDGTLFMVLSRVCAAPSARLGHLAFEGQGAFAC
ncbi:MAG: hypothetical protein ACI9ZH_001556 [Paracoccaceae bacterium]|jgi:hypothetical protein